MPHISESNRLRAWLLHQKLMENLQQASTYANVGPDPMPIGKLYFKRTEVYDRIIAKMKEMAPDGVNDQQQFLEILEGAIKTINDELKNELSQDEMANIVLTINDVERELLATPYQKLNLNENQIEMGKKYQWKEMLMSQVKSRLKERGDDNMSQEEIKDVLEQVIEDFKEEIDQTLHMIQKSLTAIVNVIPADKFFASIAYDL
jgi:hypothetical protein